MSPEAVALAERFVRARLVQCGVPEGTFTDRTIRSVAALAPERLLDGVRDLVRIAGVAEVRDGPLAWSPAGGCYASIADDLPFQLLLLRIRGSESIRGNE